MANFPTSVASQRTYSTTEYLSNMATVGHIALHQSHEGELAALGTKLGTGASTAAAGQVLRGTGAGTSSWGQVVLTTDVSGVLPVANGGTGQSTLTSLPLVTPTIASFVNATHDHSNAAGGGQLGTSAYQDNSVTYAKLDLSAVPRANVSRSTLQTIGTGADTAMSWDTETYDVGSCWSAGSPTRFTAPEAGLYAIFAHITFTANATGRRAAIFYKNGSATVASDYHALLPATLAANHAIMVYDEYVLAQGDYMEIDVFQDSGGNLDTIAARCSAGFRKVAE